MSLPRHSNAVEVSTDTTDIKQSDDRHTPIEQSQYWSQFQARSECFGSVVAANAFEVLDLKIQLQEHQDIRFIISDKNKVINVFHHEDHCSAVLSAETKKVYKSFFLIKGPVGSLHSLLNY